MDNRKKGTLVGLGRGECGCVTKIRCESAMRRRLQDVGMVEGTEVACLFRSPQGDPTAYLIRGAVIALRAHDACCIEVSGRTKEPLS